MKKKFGIGIRSCSECETMNSAVRCMRALQFFHSNVTESLEYGINFRSALEFDRESQEILVNEELLMQAIIFANPGQKRRRLKLVSEEEFETYKNSSRILAQNTEAINAKELSDQIQEFAENTKDIKLKL